MSYNMVDDVLSVVRGPAHARLHDLMERTSPADMTTQEVFALVAVLEAVDQRVNARTAPVFELVPSGNHSA